MRRLGAATAVVWAVVIVLGWMQLFPGMTPYDVLYEIMRPGGGEECDPGLFGLPGLFAECRPAF